MRKFTQKRTGNRQKKVGVWKSDVSNKRVSRKA